MHPRKRSDAGQYWLEDLQPPEIYASAAAANQAARGMMEWYAKMLNELGDSDEFDFQHNEDQECGDVGLYNGKLVRKKAHTATEIRVFRVKGPEGADEERLGRETRTKNGDADLEEEEEGDEKPAPTRKRTLPWRSKAPSRSSTSAPGSGKGKGKAAAAPAKTAVQPSTYRKKIPEGKPNCLKGLKILFTGTFETMDRKTSIATAIKYGAEVITKLEDTDYIVVGLRAGPKKLQEINKKELETISEEFFRILENGVGREKRERMAARRRADEEARAGEENDADDTARGKGRRKRARR
ncbi:hypothetical protein DL769_008576 [Monosporascus sp. CRB-8-3]|nr:hypothetical protein DL769_008576 [Monosporascus sp. CRB-8-3]